MSFCDVYHDARRVHHYLDMDGVDTCEHVQASETLAYAVFVEHSDMGIHDARVVCKPCYDLAMEQERTSTQWCLDCRSDKPAPECRRWREWDFNPAEGGEDIHICDPCREKPKHLAREARDLREREAYYKEEAKF